MTGTLTWDWVSSHGAVYADVFQGSIGSATLLNGHSAGSGTTYTSPGNDCDLIDFDSGFFVTVVNASDVTAFRTYFETGGSAPNENYGVLYVPALGGHTRVISLDSPLNGATTPTNSVSLQFSIFYNSAEASYNTVGVELNNITQGFQANTATTSITASGGSSYSLSNYLTSGDLYSWRAFISDSTGVNPTIYSDLQTFIVEVNNLQTPLNYDPNTATSTIGEILNNFLNVPSLFARKVPFAYLPAVSSLIISNATLTGTSTFPTMVWDLGLGVTTSPMSGISLTVFSTSTITHFLPSNTLNLMRTLLSGILWITAVFIVYREVTYFF